MLEIRFHGRGGHGVKTSAQILGRAAYLAGFKVQDFSMYGAERRGAPVTSFVRFDKDEIKTRGYIFEPDIVVVLDDSLDFNRMLKGLKPNGYVVINRGSHPHFLGGKYKNRAFWINGTKIALEVIGKPIPNCVILGALVHLIKPITLEHLKKAIETEFKGHMPEDIILKNKKAAELGYESFKSRVRVNE